MSTFFFYPGYVDINNRISLHCHKNRKSYMEIRDIGENIKKFRIASGLTQSELAEKVNVSFQQIQKYENGKSRIFVDRLQAIAEALDVNICKFFEEKEDAAVKENRPVYYGETKILFNITSEEKNIVIILRKLKNKKIKEMIVRLLKVIREVEEVK
jgi:transcriptional regulator with XRE-family HTH domain